MFRPLQTALSFTLLYAPADAASATKNESAAPSPVLEIVSFKLIDGSDEGTFLDAARGTENMLRARGSLIRRFLVKDENGLWTDIIEWTSMEEALSAAEAVMQEPDFAAFGAMIDGPTVEMRHAPILWRMD